MNWHEADCLTKLPIYDGDNVIMIVGYYDSEDKHSMDERLERSPFLFGWKHWAPRTGDALFEVLKGKYETGSHTAGRAATIEGKPYDAVFVRDATLDFARKRMKSYYGETWAIYCGDAEWESEKKRASTIRKIGVCDCELCHSLWETHPSEVMLHAMGLYSLRHPEKCIPDFPGGYPSVLFNDPHYLERFDWEEVARLVAVFEEYVLPLFFMSWITGVPLWPNFPKPLEPAPIEENVKLAELTVKEGKRIIKKNDIP